MRPSRASSPLKLVVYTCMIPYMLGTLVLLALINPG